MAQILCDAKLPQKKNQRVIVYNLFNDNEELEKTPDKYKKQILDSIISQNQCIKNFLMDKNLENEIVFKYFIKSKNPKLKQSILEVSPNLKLMI